MDRTAAAVVGGLCIASHPDHAEVDYGALGVVSVRMEPVDTDTLDNVIHVNGSAQQSTSADENAVAVLLVVERAMKGTSNLLRHCYSPVREVCDYLAASEHAVLREDAALLSFAMAMMPGRRGFVDRVVKLRAVETVETENRILREALGIPSGVPVTPTLAQSSMALQSAAVMSRSTSSRPGTVPTDLTAEQVGCRRRPQRTGSLVMGSSCVASSTCPPPPPDSSGTPGVIDDDPNNLRPPLHSPLQWDTETEAAINARTKYQAYNTKYDAPPRLDKISQDHLVTRLHDKSLDLKQRRLAEMEEQGARSLGRQERRVLSLEEEHELGARLHDKQRETTKQKMEKLRAQYLPEVPRRALTPDVMKASAARMHDETMAKAKKNLESLVQHYVYERDPPPKKLDKKAMEEMASRLCSAKR